MTLRAVATPDEGQDSGPKPGPESGIELPCIYQYAHRLPESVTGAVDATARMHRDLYQQVDCLVAAHRDHDGLRLVKLSKAGLRDRISQSARFFVKNKKGMMEPGGVHDHVLDSVFSDVTRWDGHFRPIVGVSDLPGVRSDGSLLDKGYDPITRMLVDWGSTEYAPIGSTRDDAIEALARISGVIDEFPFRANLDVSVAISLLLAAVQRRLMRFCPAYLIDSPESAAGKSLIVNCACAIMTGRRAEAQNAPKTDDEFRKRVFAMLRAGEKHIAFDNISGSFGGEAFDAVVTSQRYADRVLGASKIEKVDNAALVTLTGRNVIFDGDGASRTARVHLLRSKQRIYKHESLPEHIAEYRYQYVADCITITRAYLLAGRPNKMRLREFDDWCARAREPLIWLGLPDPADSITLEADMKMSQYTEVVQAWHDYCGFEPKVLSRLVADLQRGDFAADGMGAKRERLKYAIMEVTAVPIGDVGTMRLFAARIRNNMNRVTADNMSFGLTEDGTRKGPGMCWAVKYHPNNGEAPPEHPKPEPEPYNPADFYEDKPKVKK